MGDDWQELLSLRARSHRTGSSQESINSVESVISDVSETNVPVYEALRELVEQASTQLTLVGQIGQTLDGRIATESGHSHYVNGEEALTHLHRLRALADAVVIGAGTAIADNPSLTVRRVEGPNPVRIVLDPHSRVPRTLKLSTDGLAETHFLDKSVCEGGPEALIDWLRAQNFRLVLIEGGPTTLSRFVAAGVLDKLHLLVAPKLLGSGRPGLTLPVVERMDQVPDLPCKSYQLGSDTLFDVTMRA